MNEAIQLIIFLVLLDCLVSFAGQVYGKGLHG